MAEPATSTAAVIASAMSLTIFGIATAVKLTATEWIVNGMGLS